MSGQGYGSEAIKWALNFGFQHANLHRIEIASFEYNANTIKLYERLGFNPEVRQRESQWHDGRRWDVVILPMLEDGWREPYGKRT